MLVTDLEKCSIYSTVLYCDDYSRVTIYIAAQNFSTAKNIFDFDPDLIKYRGKYREYCYYPLSILCENSKSLDSKDYTRFLNGSNCQIFEEDFI